MSFDYYSLSLSCFVLTFFLSSSNRNNVTTAMHSDVPVAPPRPLHEMWVACTRRSVGDENQMLAPEERITIHQALKMKTIDAAAVIGCDGKFSSPHCLPAPRVDLSLTSLI